MGDLHHFRIAKGNWEYLPLLKKQLLKRKLDPDAVGLSLSHKGNLKLTDSMGTLLLIVTKANISPYEYGVLRGILEGTDPRMPWLLGIRAEAVQIAGEKLGVRLSEKNGTVKLQIGKSTCTCPAAAVPLKEALSETEDGGLGPDRQGLLERFVKELEAYYKDAVFDWDGREIPEELSCLREISESYALLADPLRTGIRHDNHVRYTYQISTDTFSVTMEAGSFTVKNGVVKGKKWSAKYLLLAKLKESKRWQSCCSYLDEALGKNRITIRYRSGKGVLFGSTRLDVCCGGFFFHLTWESVAYKDGIAAWRKDCDRMIHAILEEVRMRQAEENRKLQKVLEPYAGNYLAEDIVDCVRKNSGNVTRPALVQSLRGTKVRLEGGVVRGRYAGNYSLIREEDILELERGLAGSGIIEEHFVNGYYQNYYVLRATQYSEKLEGFGGEADAGEAERALQEGRQITDRQAQAVFEHLSGNERNLSDWMLLLKLASNEGFVCRNENAYIRGFSGMPKEIRQFCRMAKEREKNPFVLRVLNRILRNPAAKSAASV